jgi:hypothetical protein
MKTAAILLIIFAVICIPLFVFINLLDYGRKALTKAGSQQR